MKRKERSINVKSEKEGTTESCGTIGCQNESRGKAKKVEQTRKKKEKQQKQTCKDKSKNHPQE